MNWIKVTDQMPEHGKDVLVCYTTHHSSKQVIVVGHYFERFREEARTDEDNYEYREEDDTYYVVEGWYEAQRNWDDYASIYIHEGHITNWAPLPETPKEKDSMETMDFGAALAALKAGSRVAREGWNGKGMWIGLHTEGGVFVRKECGTSLTYRDYIVMKTVDDQLVPWVASQTDMLAEDWVLL